MGNRDSALQISESVITEITNLHREVCGCITTAFDKAVLIGERLTCIKGALNHGEWLPWLEKNVPFSQKTAWEYMSAYARRDELKPKLEAASNLNWRSLISMNSNGHGPQQLHESDFWIRNSKLGQTWFGAINHELKDRPLEKWRRDQWIDLASTLAPFAELYAKLKNLIG